MNDALRCTLPAKAEAVDGLCARLRRTVLAGLHPRDRFAIELLAREALLNAVLHGTGNPNDKIRCAVEPVRDGIRIRVYDNGNGFDWKGWRRRRRVFRSESGRGLDIMHVYASKVRFNEKGNRVEMIRTFLEGNSHAGL